jgi:dethiobiotin synthase
VLTLFISGSDTGIGKTRVAAVLGRVAARHGHKVQFIKPVQCGAAPGEPTDADEAARLAGLPGHCAHTLLRFRAALAPVSAAVAEGVQFNIADLAPQFLRIPQCDLRLVEGVGGLAVPLAPDGLDSADFPILIGANAVVLVVADRLGAINQARLVHHYFSHRNPTNLPHGIFLNALTPPPPEVAASTRAALIACGIPLWGELAAGSLEPILHPPLAQFLGL